MTKFVACILLLAFAVACQRTERGDVIRIGAVASLSGPAGEQGKNWVNGARLAAHELNSRGVHCGLFVEDDETSPGKAVSALRKLAALDKVSAVIGGTWDYLAESSFPVARDLKLPFLTATNPNELLSSSAQANPQVFTNAMSVSAEIEALGPLLKSLAPKSIALIYPNLPWGTVHADAVDRLSADLGIAVSYREAFPFEGYLDALRISALKVKETGVELVYSPISYEGILVLAAEFDALKIQPYLVVSQHLDAALATAPAKDLLRKAYGVYPAVNEGRFNPAYRAMFHEEPRVYAASGYDAMMFLVLAKAAGVDVSSAGARFSYDGVTGTHSLPARGRSIADTRAMITAVREGRMVPWSTP